MEDSFVISWYRTNFGNEDVQKLAESVQKGHISMGPVTGEFENKIGAALGVPYIVATTSGSVALLMALMALGIKNGDEVIIPNRTWIATAHAPIMLGATVALVDVLPDIPIIDTSLIRRKITSNTKAIIPVPLNGRAVDMEEVWKIADEYGLFVIEDAAQALLSINSGTYMGTQSDVGCFSLSMPKLIPTGQGGFIATKNRKTFENLKRIRMHGVDDVIHCTYHQMGFNFRLTDLQSSLGLVQLANVQQRVDRLKKVYQKYESSIKEFEFLKLIPVDIPKGQVPLYVEVLCSEREKLIAFLASKGIQTRPFYPNLDTAVHLGCSEEFPNSKIFGDQGMMLPCGPDQPFENIDRVIEMLGMFEKEYHLRTACKNQSLSNH
ncbi:MAG: DegT/DnrJ/EryC1/StrS family aminotransferase [Syntrophus sp. (in: bacteria)]